MQVGRVRIQQGGGGEGRWQGFEYKYLRNLGLEMVAVMKMPTLCTLYYFVREREGKVGA